MTPLRLYLRRMTIADLEEFFSTHELPETFEISQAERTNDVQKMVNSHLATLTIHGITPTYYGFYQRLIKLKDAMDS